MLGLDHEKIILLSSQFWVQIVVVKLFCSMLEITDIVLYCCSQGSVIVLLNGLFDKNAQGTKVAKLIDAALASVVASGSIPVPAGQTFSALRTVPTALPMVVMIPDQKGSRLTSSLDYSIY